jgi:hypothetical protein
MAAAIKNRLLEFLSLSVISASGASRQLPQRGGVSGVECKSEVTNA